MCQTVSDLLVCFMHRLSSISMVFFYFNTLRITLEYRQFRRTRLIWNNHTNVIPRIIHIYEGNCIYIYICVQCACISSGFSLYSIQYTYSLPSYDWFLESPECICDVPEVCLCGILSILEILEITSEASLDWILTWTFGSFTSKKVQPTKLPTSGECTLHSLIILSTYNI